MNDSVSFVTPGLIDPLCITTIGVSVKETENPIGFFGTGLKYAIAIILRVGGEITVWRGLEPLRFSKLAKEIRGKQVDIVCMNGQELGFTTELGKHWKMWQAFREIHCNTLDERGETRPGLVAPSGDVTTIQVSCPEFAECYSNIGLYILQSTALYAAKQASFHPGPTRGIFYRSIRVHDGAPKPWLFAPNILERVDLTEDRTLKDYWAGMFRVVAAVLECEDERFIEQWLTAGPEYAEHELDLDWSHIKPSAAFLKVVANLARDPSRLFNVSAVLVLGKHAVTPHPTAAELFPSEAQALRRAIDFCHRLKYPVDEYPIKVVESLGPQILGRADTKERVILLAKRAIQMGDLTLAGTLIEEWAHIKHGFKDCSREMQNWLFEQLTRVGDAYLYELGTRGTA